MQVDTFLGGGNYQSNHEKYLLRDTEIFARFFESYMIHCDQQNGTSKKYRLDFTEEEIEKGTPLLMLYLQEIKSDYEEEMALFLK